VGGLFLPDPPDGRSPYENFLGKIDWILANLVKFGENSGEIRAKLKRNLGKNE